MDRIIQPTQVHSYQSSTEKDMRNATPQTRFELKTLITFPDEIKEP